MKLPRAEESMEEVRQMRDPAADNSDRFGVRETTLPWDALEYLKTDEEREAYFRAAMEVGDPELLNVVLADISKASKVDQ